MFQLRLPVRTVLGVLALTALLLPQSVMAQGLGASVRSQVIRAAAAPFGGAVTLQELPGCTNPSEPFAGASQGCPSSWSVGDWAIFDGTAWSRGPRQTTSLDGTFNRGPRQTTSLDGSINPETGALSLGARDYQSHKDNIQSIDLQHADVSVHHLFVPERGPDLSADPTYNSALASTAGLMGYGWSFPYSMSLRVYRGAATITQENGSQAVFKLGADKRFHAAPRVIASFVQNPGGSYTLTRGSFRRTCPSYLLQSCERFTFSIRGRLRRETTVDGSVRITRDGLGRPTSAVADSGDTLAFRYTSGRITSIIGSDGASEQFTYDWRHNLKSVTDPNGNTTRFTYDAAHRLTGVRDPLGRTTLYRYGSSGRVTAVTDALGRKTTYHYGSADHTTTITSPEGRRVVLSYKARELVDVAAGPVGTTPLAERAFAYDPRTLAGTKWVDPVLHVTSAARDADGLPLSLTDALGKTTTFTHNPAGRRFSVTDPMGVTTTFTYDKNGNVLTESTPDTSLGAGQVQTYAWTYHDAAHPGDMTSSIDPLGNETHYTYDSRGLPATVTDPLGNTWTYSFHRACLFSIGRKGAPRGLAASEDTITDPLGHTTTYTCDANGNLLTTTDATGAVTTNTYDADNELVSTTDPAGRKTTYSYDPDGRLTAIHQPDGTTSHATYGADGELATIVDPAGGTQSFTYDALGRRIRVSNQIGLARSVELDAAGNVTSSTDAMGVTATNTYDAANRLLSTDYSDGATPAVSYTYDADGRRTSMTDGTGTTTYEYDSLGRMTSTQDSFKDVIDSDFNLRGDRTSITYPNGHAVTMQYDGNGQMTGVTDWLGNTTLFQYDGAGNCTSSHVVGGKTTTWAYDAADRKVHGIHRGEGGSVYASFDYTRAADGRIISVDTTGLGQPTQSYGYDANGRLGSENANGVTFDSRNNVTTLPDGSSLSYDAADELVSRQSGPLVTSYSVNGDGERIGTSSSVQSLSYGWSGAGDLTSFTDNGTTTTYSLNGDGERTSSSTGGVAHRFVWDTPADARGIVTTKPGGGYAGGSPPANARDYNLTNTPNSGTASPLFARGLVLSKPGGSTGSAAGRVLSDGTHSFIYGPDGLPIEQIDSADHALFLDEDAQGSVRVLTDAAGNVQGTASYDAFGNQTAQSGATSPFGYEGMYVDAESGLYAISGGAYDPATGQRLKSYNPVVVYEPGDTVIFQSSRTGSQHHYVNLRVGDGIDESCQGKDDLCASSPYAFGGGDPVNGSAAGPRHYDDVKVRFLMNEK